MQTSQQVLSGWGRAVPTRATVHDAPVDELTDGGRWAELCRHPRGVVVRGLGRSYGDPAQNAGGAVLRLRPGAAPIDLDPATGHVVVDAAVSLDTLLRHIVPRGWFVPVTPGTRFVTIGGAVATDIHGKNHHLDGSFGDHVREVTLLLADGCIRTIDPTSDGDLWAATIGGMGLTGAIIRVGFRLLPIETSRCLVDTERVPDLDTLLDRMTTGDDDHRYSVAWIDLGATGRRTGRSVLTRGDHATEDELGFDGRARDAAADPLAYDPPAPRALPPGLPNLVTRGTVRAFNELWYRRAPSFATTLESIPSFFHPLDGVGSWNRAYGRRGFLQYQFVVPPGAVDTLREVVHRVSAAGEPSFLAVLKRFGPEGAGLLSFPRPGWTLSIDLPAGRPRLPALLAGLDRLVLDAGGRHYLAKDAVAGPEVVRAGYPRLDEWRAIRRTVDPDGVWVSDLARRLDLL